MQTIINLGTGGSDLNGQNGSTTSADSNDALFLDWPGDNAGNYVYLPGVSGNYLSVPDEAALDITGDIDIRVHVAMDDWTPSSNSSLLAKYVGAGTGRSYLIRVDTSGALQLLWSLDGTTAITRTSTDNLSIADGSAKWVRATLDVDNGASGHDVKFYTSDDGSTWTQLGSTITTAGTTSIFSGAADVIIGARDVSSSDITTGKFYRAQIFDGIDGTKVLDVDTSVLTSGAATSFPALTGQTVTIDRSTSGRKSVAVVSPCWLFGTDDRIQVAHNDLLSTFDGDAIAVVLVFRVWDDTTNNAGYISKKVNTSLNPGWVIYRDGTNDEIRVILDDSTGDRTFDDTPTYTEGALSVYAFGYDTAANLRRVYLDGSNTDATPGSQLNDLSNTEPLVIGARFLSSSYNNFEVIGVTFYRRLLSVTELDAIRTYYQNRLT